MVKYQELDRHRAQLAADLVGFALCWPDHDIFEHGRGSPETCFARQVAMYLTHVGSHMSFARVGFAFGKDRSTVGHACQQIEERRDDPDFDAWIDGLELVVRHAMKVEPGAARYAEQSVSA